jgi:hypothetical protein
MSKSGLASSGTVQIMRMLFARANGGPPSGLPYNNTMSKVILAVSGG